MPSAVKSRRWVTRLLGLAMRSKIESRIFFVAMVAPLLAIGGCSPPPTRIPSPDAALELLASVETSKADLTSYRCVVIEIRNKAGQVLYKENTHASDTMNWSIAWVSTNKIRLDSSDIGTYFWVQQAQGGWRRATD